MTIRSSGAISMQDIATELGISVTGLSLNDSRVRALAGVPSGAISMSNLYGKSASTWGVVAGEADNLAATSAIRSITISFNSDGSTNGYGSWWAPSVSGIGASYFIKYTTSGVANTNFSDDSVGSWHPMTFGSSITLANNATTTEAVGQLTVQFSTAGSDATIVKTYASAINWDVGKSH